VQAAFSEAQAALASALGPPARLRWIGALQARLAEAAAAAAAAGPAAPGPAALGARLRALAALALAQSGASGGSSGSGGGGGTSSAGLKGVLRRLNAPPSALAAELRREVAAALLRPAGGAAEAALLRAVLAAAEELEAEAAAAAAAAATGAEAGRPAAAAGGSGGAGSAHGAAAAAPPQALLCPIGQATMTDPVILVATGQTFERAAIVEWLSRARTCPLTRQPLASVALVPNFLARSLLDQAGLPLAPLPAPVAPAPAAARAPSPPRARANQRPPALVLLPAAEMEGFWSLLMRQDPATPAAARRLVELNHGADGLCRLLTSEDPAAQRQGAWAIDVLANDINEPFERLSVGCLAALPDLLGAADGAVVAQAASALASIGASGCGELLEPLDDVPCFHLGIATLLAHGPDDVASDLAWFLANVADSCSTYLRDRLTCTPSLLASLVALLERPSVAHCAAWALTNLAKGQAAGLRVALTGDLIPLLPSLLAHDDEDVMGQAVSLVRNLARVEGGDVRARMAAVPGLFAALASSCGEHPGDAMSALADLASAADAAACRQIADACLPYLAAQLGSQSRDFGEEVGPADAAAVLGDLARSDGGALRARVAAEPGVIAGLVALLGRESRQEYRRTTDFALQAARALAALSVGDARDGGEDIRRAIAAEEGSLPGLAALLAVGTAAADPAARVLANLSADAQLRPLIAATNGILPRLAALRDAGSPVAARVLDLLALPPRLPRVAKRPRGG